MSVRDILAQSKLVRISHEVSGDVRSTQESLKDIVAKGYRKDEKLWVNTAVFPRGKAQIRAACLLWNVSEAQLVRLALHRVLSEFGIAAEEILQPRDVRAAGRSPRARRPFSTVEQATLARRKSFVLAEHSHLHDPSQPQ